MAELERNKKQSYVFWRNDDRPFFIMLMGIPADPGKTTFSTMIRCETADGELSQPHIYSSDALKKEYFENYIEGNAQDRETLFVKIGQAIKEDLMNDNNVIFDATNIDHKRRVALLNSLKKCNANKRCIVMMTPYDVCLSRLKERGDNISLKDVEKYYKSFDPPMLNEGWDLVAPIYSYDGDENKEKYDLEKLFHEMDGFDQDNPHHIDTLGEHCRKTMQCVEKMNPNDKLLQIAALIHDCGKLYTKTYETKRGVANKHASYHQHHCVSAYESMFYLDRLGVSSADQLRIANILYYHMHPSNAWAQSSRAEKKDRTLIGEEMYNQIKMLNQADMMAKQIEIKKEEIEEKEEIEIERE